ncbi:hypothetical protein GOEFS_018_00580 [Gordonia effusa NBRC 100432]|uniref:DUF2613 domain-containing protein n=1 Tax=Gordonia effusa NBRC 100432 TaxID=1077974 RepID=H0QW25_9ACTN|nr:DUF2613 family protein [Gordonia effusa]GAB17026.1 hypothetical protein GOEFS_018_00580 [Gordonia effusa NBRC 100432]
MTSNRLIAGAVAAVAGVIIGLGSVVLGGLLSADNSPATDLNNVNPNNGFIQGSVDYGSRGDGGNSNN